LVAARCRDAGFGDDLADEGQADIDVTLGEQGHCTAAALGGLILGFIASVMPSFRIVSSKLTPAAAPDAAFGNEMYFASRRTRLTSSAVAMAGFGAPVRTAMPTETVAFAVGNHMARGEHRFEWQLHNRHVERLAPDDLGLGSTA